MWFRNDIEAALRFVDSASNDIAQHVPTKEMALYRAGFEAAIAAIAAAFGIAWQSSSRAVVTRKNK